jgi:CBS domain-containing protein
MRENGHKVLPVVSRANARIMLGVVTFGDILKEFGVDNAEELDYRDHPDLGT